MSRNQWDDEMEQVTEAWGRIMLAVFIAFMAILIFSFARAEQIVTCDTVRGIVRANPDKSIAQLATLYHLNSSEVDLAMSCLSHPGPRAVKTEKVHAPRPAAGVRADPYDTDGRRRAARPAPAPVPVAPVSSDLDHGGQAKPVVEPVPNVVVPVQRDLAEPAQHHDEPPAPPVAKPKMEGWRAMSMEVLLMILAAVLGWEGSKLGYKGVLALFRKWASREKPPSADVLTGVVNDVRVLMTNHGVVLDDLSKVKQGLGALDAEFHARLQKLESPAQPASPDSPQPATAAPTGPAAPVA